VPAFNSAPFALQRWCRGLPCLTPTCTHSQVGPHITTQLHIHSLTCVCVRLRMSLRARARAHTHTHTHTHTLNSPTRPFSHSCRTESEIAEANGVNLAELRDPQTDSERVIDPKVPPRGLALSQNGPHSLSNPHTCLRPARRERLVSGRMEPPHPPPTPGYFAPSPCSTLWWWACAPTWAACPSRARASTTAGSAPATAGERRTRRGRHPPALAASQSPAQCQRARPCCTVVFGLGGSSAPQTSCLLHGLLSTTRRAGSISSSSQPLHRPASAANPSHYDISGRIRKGPAPTNLEVSPPLGCPTVALGCCACAASPFVPFRTSLALPLIFNPVSLRGPRSRTLHPSGPRVQVRLTVAPEGPGLLRGAVCKWSCPQTAAARNRCIASAVGLASACP
jgi:hypothetical protein